MSLVKMKSEDIIEKCNLALEAIKKRKLRIKKGYIDGLVERKNSGFTGWIRRLFNRQYDIKTATCYLEGWYSFDNPYYMVNSFYREDERVAKSIIKMAQESSEVFVSRKDFNMFGRFIGA